MELLFTSLQNKRANKIWTKTHEELANKLLGLCIEARNSHVTKEALHFYRNICQNQVHITHISLKLEVYEMS